MKNWQETRLESLSLQEEVIEEFRRKKDGILSSV